MTSIYFQTHGCSTNVSESEIMMALLKQAKFDLVSEPENADIIIINVCTVKGEETTIREIRKLNIPNKKLIVAGCITKRILNEAREIREDVSFISTDNIQSIVEVVEETLNDNPIEATARNEEKKINLPKIRKTPLVGIIPILNSCANYCSYCSVKYVKGKLLSYEIKDIVCEAQQCIQQGCKELWITSQDNAAYMLDKSPINMLPELIENVTKLDGKFYVRIGMMNPRHLTPILDRMIEVYKHPKVFKFLHIPVQSGNNRILGLMKRNYTVDDFKNIIAAFRNKIPEITISTDIIVGFPTETEEEFQDSINLVREIKPDVLNISRFQARPGTEAARMDGQIHGNESKVRSTILTEVYLIQNKVHSERWIGWQGQILIDEKGKEDSWSGRNYAYRPVIVKGDFKLGDIVNVRVTDVTAFDLRAEVITC